MKLLHKNLNTNNSGHLTFAGADTLSLAEQFGTPLMLLDEEGIRANCREYLSAVRLYRRRFRRKLYRRNQYLPVVVVGVVSQNLYSAGRNKIHA